MYYSVTPALLQGSHFIDTARRPIHGIRQLFVAVKPVVRDRAACDDNPSP